MKFVTRWGKKYAFLQDANFDLINVKSIVIEIEHIICTQVSYGSVFYQGVISILFYRKINLG